MSIHCEKLAVILKTQQNNNKQTKYKNNVVRRIAMYVMARHVAMYVVQAVVVVVVFSGDSYKSIAFCSIRGGGRGSGGVILYEKKIATVAGSYRGISATFCKEHCNVSETYRPRSPSRILQKQTFLPKTHS